MNLSKTLKIFIAFFALVAWAGVFLQFYTGIPSFLSGAGRTLPGVILELCSFFTIQTNFMVALCFTAAALSAPANNWLLRPGVLTALAVNITIVALVYNLVLRQTYHPVGLARVGDEIVHVTTPLFYLIFWLLAVPKRGLTYKGGFTWLLYPALYLVYILIRGALSGMYPYFFLDVVKFGYPEVMVNIAALIALFLGMDMLFIFIGRLIGKNKTS